MQKELKITFKITVFSKFGSLVDKFTVEASTKQEANFIVEQTLIAQGIFKDVNYKIT